ncbi:MULTISPECIES: hypothetical protein [Pseudonocardia]|uniref:Uncharacterized protein n=2 Tax=Pseudonocardia TaxID=1847 RepID=A0A1Y2MIB2_PSEAH|nr:MULTISPECIES: hypothetical protein [Pseudonocardia]OSY34437.1 hypothetical protein BG845_06862 [Pseudonocardia autotrophica]TDN72011.1 hypothetical protein C8E95_1049 [Pseudonocardia autotrophica]BBG02700.1 hypothetical protein Pdca_39090 [Pseudonocardia autotrophica]GEC29725.1 hypothetical protein PSA01_67540 [Pseudonocardia saturnea]
MTARFLVTGLLTLALAGGGAGTALADPPATTDPTPMTVTSLYGPVEATALNVHGEGPTFSVPAGGQIDIPTDEGGYTRLVISENGQYIGEYPLYNPRLHSFCEVRPAAEDPRLSCGIIA